MAGIVAIGGLMSLAACGAGRNRQNDSVSADASAETAQTAVSVPEFSTDSAMGYLRRQVEKSQIRLLYTSDAADEL